MRRALHVGAWVVAAVIAFAVVLGAALMVIGNTAGGRRLLERSVSWASHGRVLMQGLSGRFPDRLRLQHLQLRDAQGTWLQADALAVDWLPLQLLERRRVHVQRLAAGNVQVLRRPVSAPGQRRSGAGAHLPVSIWIDQLAVPRLTLDAALAGRTVALQLQGSGRFASLQRASVQLSAARLDEVPASYRAQVQLDAQHIQLQLDVQEGADGPLANLLRLPGLGALAVHLQLSGPRAALAARLTAQAGALHAQAAGTVNLPGRAATLDLSLQSAAMSPRAGLAWQQVSLQAHARGSLTAPTTTAHLSLTGLRAGSVQLDSLQADLRGEGRALALDAMLAGLTLPSPVRTLLHAAPIRLHGEMQLPSGAAPVLDVKLSHPLITARAHYRFGRRGAGVATSMGAGTFTARLPQLAPWAALAHLSLQGEGTLQGRLDTARARAGAARQLTLSAVLQPTGAPAPWSALLGHRVDLSAAVSFGGGAVRLQRAQLRAAGLQGGAKGEDHGGRLDVAWQLAVPQLSALAAQAAGQLNAQGRVQGRIPRLGLAASVAATFTERRVPGSIQLMLQARDLPQHPSGRVDVSGMLDHAPLRFAATLQPQADGALALTVAQARWRSLQANGTLRLRAGSLREPQGRLSLRMARLADLDALLGRPVQGSVDASVTLEKADGRSRARLVLQGRDVGVPSQQISSLQLHGDIDQPLRSPRLALRLAAAGSIRATAVKLAASANGAPSALQLRVTASTGAAAQSGGAAQAGAARGGASPQLAAQATWYQAQRQLALQHLSASYRGQSLRLLAPAQVSFRSGLRVQHLRVGIGAAVIEANGSVTPALDLRASVSNLTATVFGALLPRFRGLHARGHADASLRLHGSLREPTGSFMLTAGGLGSGAGGAGGLPPGAIKVRAQLAGTAANVNVMVNAGKQMQLQASGRLPLRLDAPMSLTVAGQMNLALANPVFEASGQRLLGELAIRAQMRGSLQNPQADGTLTLMHADVQDYVRGLRISDINGTLLAAGSQLRLTQLSARAGSGTISASGGVDLSARGTPVHLQFTAHGAQLLKSDLLTADVDSNLHVSGTLLPRRLSAEGTVRINSATINIPNALPPDVPVLNVVRPGQQAPVQAAAPPRPVIAALNVTLNAPSAVFVRGRGLNAQVGGTLHVSGSSSRPNIAGGFDLIRGTFDLSGATLTFNSGRIGFNGTGLRHKIDPTLDFTATTYTGGITATLNVSGYADAPVITLSSKPIALPQDEILARLLFGESVSQLSALQIAGIGAALVTLSGVGGGGGFNPLTTVQRALGLNRLVVSGGTSAGTSTANSTGGSQNSGATIEAGRYITNRIYIGAKQSTNGLTQAQVQVDLTRKWKLQTTLSTGGGTVQGATPQNDPGSNIGMSYQFDY